MDLRKDNNSRIILVTGAAGFIGSYLTLRLLKMGARVVGFDNLNDYYDPRLKEYRLGLIEDAAKESKGSWRFVHGDLVDRELVGRVFRETSPSIVVNLAAQAGVRYSITNPDTYIESNLIGFYNILEACRHSYDDGASGVAHLVYASSSPVYGSDAEIPFSIEALADRSVSLYVR